MNPLSCPVGGKFADKYKTAELMFYPFKLWLKKRGPSPVFRVVLRSNIKGSSKVTIMAYIGTSSSPGGFASW